MRLASRMGTKSLRSMTATDSSSFSVATRLAATSWLSPAPRCWPWILGTAAIAATAKAKRKTILRMRFPPVLSRQLWRKRVGVEPTPEPAKDTGNGFEGHEDHRAPFASAIRARIIAQGFSWLASPRLAGRPFPLVWFQILSSPQPLPNSETRAPLQSYRAATLV